MRQYKVSFIAFFVTMVVAGTSYGQLQISEVMYNTVADEGVWEWFELVNAGSETVDLDGYVFDDFNISNNAQTEPNIIGLDSGGGSATTSIPAGGVAVIYNGARLEYDESRFRSAWNLGPSVPLIGVSDFESLNNSGDTFGIWASFDDYTSDLENTDDDEQLEVSNFFSAAAWLDYAAEGFPTATNATIAWTGEGDYQDGSNWITSTEETEGVVTSVQTLLPTSPLNNLNDTANPGVVLGDGDADGLVITELMFNPASAEPSEWEWIEVVNGTGAEIDFSATPYVLDDLASGPLSEANIATGTIADGEVAILFQDSITEENMIAAWGDDVNFIPVSSWSALNNGGDTIGIWSSFDSYSFDSPEEGDRTFDETVATITYDDGADDWPNVSDGQSISVLDLEGDSNDPTNWVLSEIEDGTSRAPEPVLSSELVDHDGGDLGSPGAFGDVVVEPPVDTFTLDVNDDGAIDAADAPLICDAVAAAGVVLVDELAAAQILGGDTDLNGSVEFADFLILSANFGSSDAHFGEGDFDCNGQVEFADFLTMSSNFGQSVNAEAASVPEPNGLFLVFLATLGIFAVRRSR